MCCSFMSWLLRKKSYRLLRCFNLEFCLSCDPSYWLFPTLKFFIVRAPCLEKFKYVCNNCLKVMNCAILVIKKKNLNSP